MVRDDGCADPGYSCALYARASDGECGGEVVEGRLECRFCMADGEGDERYYPPMFLEFRDEGDLLVGLGFAFFSHPSKARDRFFFA
jgi:hypothetical protein